MNDPAPKSGLSAAKLAERKRLAVALRENLKRRKAQVRQRDHRGDETVDEASLDGAARIQKP
ncbi:MAG: hypothetical protein KGQ46_02800 [Hyphomicrobiales bacterium]|nr:hypothetical protein [Hyphomicrobiales bacterium]MDE2116126.1 hypothetical protein [Hyphomicrobiales bacterium]